MVRKIHQYWINKNSGSSIELNSNKQEGKYVVEKFVRGKTTPVKRSVIVRYKDLGQAKNKVKSLKSKGKGWSGKRQTFPKHKK